MTLELNYFADQVVSNSLLSNKVKKYLIELSADRSSKILFMIDHNVFFLGGWGDHSEGI